MKTTKFFTLLVFISIFATSCKTGEQQRKFDYGNFENGIYTNNYLDFNVVLPENWIFTSHLQLTDSDSTTLVFDPEKIKSLLLFAAYPNSQNSVEENSPNLVVNIINRNMSEATDDEYLSIMYQQIRAKFPNIVHIEKEFKVDTLNNGEFNKLTLLLLMNLENKQLVVANDYYVFFNKNFAILFIASYKDAAEKEMIKNIIASIRFGTKE